MADKVDIPYYLDYISPPILNYLRSNSSPVKSVPNLFKVNNSGSDELSQVLETTEALHFVTKLYDKVSQHLAHVLHLRQKDREFIDNNTKWATEFNENVSMGFRERGYKTVIGQKDDSGRVVIGPNSEYYFTCKKDAQRVAPLPEHLRGTHVTLFGPPDSTRMAINAMNSLHRALPGEPEIVKDLIEQTTTVPKWGADDEDSRTPLYGGLLQAAENLTQCFNRTITSRDEATKTTLRLAPSRLAHPIKRFPGLALPSLTYFRGSSPLPLHLYDFALHVYHLYNNPEALTFYVPKLENEDEAAYIHDMIESAENLLAKDPVRGKVYVKGTIKILVVLENPRAVYRLNEIMDALYPYFAGASLGWHDFLASTARLFAYDPNYRIPAKSDADIVIKYIKESHLLLSRIVAPRGGITIGGMYGVLPDGRDLTSPSFQVTLIGYIRDVVVQLRRGLDGFWVAHPDFVRIGIAIVEAWKHHVKLGNRTDDSSPLVILVKSLIRDPIESEKLLSFIFAGDTVASLDYNHFLYPRALLAADIDPSQFIPNNTVEEMSYNVFQALQYLADWLAGNGCVALPAAISNVKVRVMDDLATTERSRWEIWHEVHHKRFPVFDLLNIVYHEMFFIQQNRKTSQKEVRVFWNERTAKWYPVARNILLALVFPFDGRPMEFVTEWLMSFTIDSIREAEDPWKEAVNLDPSKFQLDHRTTKFLYWMDIFPCQHFATSMSEFPIYDKENLSRLFESISEDDIIEAAEYFIPEISNQKDLQLINSLLNDYKSKYGLPFVAKIPISSSSEIKARLDSNDKLAEFKYAKDTLLSIAESKLKVTNFEKAAQDFQVAGISISVVSNYTRIQSITAGFADKETNEKVTPNTWFEVASLSKTFAAAFTLEYFKKHNLSLDDSVNRILDQFSKHSWRLEAKDPKNADWGDKVTVRMLLNHSALGMHYVYGIPTNHPMPHPLDFILGTYSEKFNYPKFYVEREPGKTFKYSGGGFIVLEYLLLEISGANNIDELFIPFFQDLGVADEFSFSQNVRHNSQKHAVGYLDSGNKVNDPKGRLMFPPLAAGGIGTANAVTKFITHLAKAYNDVNGSGPISHDTAVQMLYASDRESVAHKEFMASAMGIGVFMATAGPNKIALHQAANDGFRGVFFMCYSGPNAGDGFVIFSNGDDNAVILNSLLAQNILKDLEWDGVDCSKFPEITEAYAKYLMSLPQEQKVNIGKRDLVLAAFAPNIPEKLPTAGPINPLSQHNLFANATVLSVTDEKFAPASNLSLPTVPIFDPKAFGSNGKIMDSWESSRHNPFPHDVAVYNLVNPIPANTQKSVRFIYVTTKYHNGNQAVSIRLTAGFGHYTDNRVDYDNEIEILPEQKLFGHTDHRFLASERYINSPIRIEWIKVYLGRDGGISRLALFDSSLAANEKKLYPSINQCKDIIPAVEKVVPPRYLPPPLDIISRNWQKVNIGQLVDVGCADFGSKVVCASNEHYGPASAVTAPIKPRGMFDGFESARSREDGHVDFVQIALAKPSCIKKILIDFTYFVHNSPRELKVEGFDGFKWHTVIPQFHAKPYATNQFLYEVPPPWSNVRFYIMKVITIPDGGFNRVKFFTVATNALRSAPLPLSSNL